MENIEELQKKIQEQKEEIGNLKQEIGKLEYKLKKEDKQDSKTESMLYLGIPYGTLLAFMMEGSWEFSWKGYIAIGLFQILPMGLGLLVGGFVSFIFSEERIENKALRIILKIVTMVVLAALTPYIWHRL